MLAEGLQLQVVEAEVLARLKGQLVVDLIQLHLRKMRSHLQKIAAVLA